MPGRKETTSETSVDFNPFKTYESITADSFIKAENSGPLKGEVSVSGTKNMVSKVIAACLSATKGETTIRNIPFVGDLDVTLSLCRRLGVDYQIFPDRTLRLSVDEFTNPDILYDPYHGNRVAILFAGPVLAKLGRANISKPEGCQIGERKIDFHLAGLEAFGVVITEHEDYYSLRLKKKCLEAANFNLPFPSVGATENLLITASCAKGESIFSNCALEPEIIELVKILQKSGVGITLFPPRTIVVNGADHGIIPLIYVPPDRIEAASLAAAAISSQGDVFVRGAQQDSLVTFLGVLQKMGAGIDIESDGIRFFWKGPLKPVDITTEIYPGFPTDCQQPMAILMSQAVGSSSIHETIFENRFRYIGELNRIIKTGDPMAVSVSCPSGRTCRFDGAGYQHLAKIRGPLEFGSGEIDIVDMRAGFAAVNTAILSRGVTVKNLKSLYRGYEDTVGKLRCLGAEIELFI